MAKNRATQIAKTFKVLKKHFTPVPTPERTVLEHLIYGCCLENAPYDKADAAYNRIHAAAFDWNEIRVTAVSELAEHMQGYVQPKRSASNLRHVLHNVFESHYSFDIDHLRKQNLGKTQKELEKHGGVTQFILGYFTQNALGGHSIPLDRGALDVLFIADVIDEKERKKNVVPGLERAVSKKQGVEFGSLLHQLGAILVASPFSTTGRDILMEINPGGKERLPKRKSKKKPAPEPKPKPTPAAKKETAKAKAGKATKKKEPAKKAAAKKKAAKKSPAPKKKVAAKKKPAKKAAKSKPKTKGKKKPAKKAAKSKPKSKGKKKPAKKKTKRK